MAFSPQVRVLWWLLFAACYGSLTFVLWKTVPWDKSYEAQFLRALAHPFCLLISSVATTILCRLAGLSLASQTESPLEVETGQIAPSVSELRSYGTQRSFRVLCALFLFSAALMVPIEFFVLSRNRTPSPFWPLFLVALAIAGVFGLVSHLKRRGQFLARADENGLEIQDLGQRNKRTHIAWFQIASAVQVQASTVMGEGTHIDIRDANGTTRAQVLLGLAPREQQGQFVQTVAHYLKPPSLV